MRNISNYRLIKRFLTAAVFLISATTAVAQYNVDRLITAGRSALFYEDFVLSIQYFSQAIDAKPYLYEPWYLRGLAKFYLGDDMGAEQDCSEAIRLNPYISFMYHLRGVCNIRMKKYDDAINDYTKALNLKKNNKDFWLNRTICMIEMKYFKQAQESLDSMISRWNKYPTAYLLKAEVYMQEGDTAACKTYIDKSLEQDEFNAHAWALRGSISLKEKQWKNAEKQFSKAIHIKSNVSQYYVNRALTRININNIRGALADYDKSIDIDSTNVLGRYNRAMLRMQVGDDNNALKDFEYIVKLEPKNIMARFNRARLRQNTGDVYGAIDDYSVILKKFPDFWVGLHQRAELYRKVGMTAKAERDEFRITNAQNNKHFGLGPARWSRKKKDQVRKMSEIDFEKYNSYVVEDSITSDREYASISRGKVQNRNIEDKFFDQELIHESDTIGILAEQNPLIFYNDGCMQAHESRYEEAIESFTKAIELNPKFAKAYFNRALARIKKGKKEEALKDLSRSGELGLYQSYGLIKKFSSSSVAASSQH